MRIIHGNILDTKIPHICHGVNSIGVMGAGVAKILRNRYPEIYNDYVTFLDTSKKHNLLKLGMTTTSIVENGSRYIHHIISQNYIGVLKSARYYAIVNGLIRILEFFPDQKEFAIPRIGCGLGGCDWNIMKILLEEIEGDYGVEFVVYCI